MEYACRLVLFEVPTMERNNVASLVLVTSQMRRIWKAHKNRQEWCSEADVWSTNKKENIQTCEQDQHSAGTHNVSTLGLAELSLLCSPKRVIVREHGICLSIVIIQPLCVRTSTRERRLTWHLVALAAQQPRKMQLQIAMGRPMDAPRVVAGLSCLHEWVEW